ncbi:hypothetical protein [Aquimarina sp. 2304DJ70-9]|uniref:hypothetical protein n=1 Tax=Aquimarina penaris TaxID=3231044 RepID=UPI00346235AB
MSQFLVIKSSNDILPSQIDFVINFISSLGNNIHFFDLNEYSLHNVINNNESPLVYTHIYIMAHGNDEVFSNNDSITHTWLDLAKLINDSGNFHDDTILILKACDGGNINVAKTIFQNCDKIKYIYGLNGEQQNFDVFFSSILFIYYIFWKEKTVEKSTELSNKASELNAVCFDRDNFELN